MTLDWNVISSVILILCGFLLIYAIVTINRAGRKNGETVETTAKIGKNGFEISNKISDNIQLQNQLVEKCFNEPYQLSSLDGKTDKDVLKHYKDTNYNDRITRLLIYIEFSKIINYAVRKTQIKLINYCANNGISKKDKEGFKQYVKSKLTEIFDIFNNHLLDSEIDSIKQLNIDKVCGYYKTIVQELLKNMYNDIYDNHLQEAVRRRAFFKQIHSIAKTEVFKRYDSFMEENRTLTSKKDAEVIEENMENLLNFLLGLFHDNLERGYSEKSK